MPKGGMCSAASHYHLRAAGRASLAPGTGSPGAHVFRAHCERRNGSARDKARAKGGDR